MSLAVTNFGPENLFVNHVFVLTELVVSESQRLTVNLHNIHYISVTQYVDQLCCHKHVNI